MFFSSSCQELPEVYDPAAGAEATTDNNYGTYLSRPLPKYAIHNSLPVRRLEECYPLLEIHFQQELRRPVSL